MSENLIILDSHIAEQTQYVLLSKKFLTQRQYE